MAVPEPIPWLSAACDPFRGNQASRDGGARIVPSSEDDHLGPGPRVMAASTLQGDDVVNAAGDKLGTLDEIMLDVPCGRIAYAVVSSGGFLGIGDNLPRRAGQLDRRFVLSAPSATPTGKR